MAGPDFDNTMEVIRHDLECAGADKGKVCRNLLPAAKNNCADGRSLHQALTHGSKQVPPTRRTDGDEV
jgi:hypothetical protein